MQLQMLSYDLSICKAGSGWVPGAVPGFFTLSVTDEEISLVCETAHVPEGMTERADGWKAFRITGILDFSLIGILSGITAVLAKARIGVFVVSTYNTDYILVRKEDYAAATDTLSANGYELLRDDKEKENRA